MAQTLPSLAIESQAPAIAKQSSCAQGCYVVGRSLERLLPRYIGDELGLTPDTPVRGYLKAMANRQMFYCKQYTRVKKRNSYTVLYGHSPPKFGQIEYFFTHGNEKYALIVELVPITQSQRINTKKLLTVRKEARFTLTTLSFLKSKCVFIQIESTLYNYRHFPQLFDPRLIVSVSTCMLSIFLNQYCKRTSEHENQLTRSVGYTKNYSRAL